MKIFIELTQVWDQEQAEPQEQPLKARFPETYLEKSHIDCYYFCQQYEDHFKISGITGMNYTPFAASFLYDTISLR